MNQSRRLLLAAFLLLPALPALANEPPYLTEKQLDLRIMLPPPVVAGSPEDKAEQEAVIAAQKSASPERIALAAADAEESVFDMYARTLGPAFAPANLPKASVFFARVGDSEDAVADAAKPYFGRVRPFLANPDAIKPLVKPSKSGAYPSGHTTRVTMVAIILAQMLPEKKDIIWARAEEYAQSRVVGGMHYPNDLEGGRRAGTAMAAVMFTDPAFRADFEVAKAEVRKAMGL
jgi:acid phosphatase (class A)